MSTDWDVIIVGGRVAGAPTAMLLARQGYRVLLVDRATFPSDTISTHLVHPTGVAALRRWGLLDRLIETGCPPLTTYAIDFDVAILTGTCPPTPDGGRTAYGPRRIVLDALLLDAAREAGAEVRDGYTVDEVLMDDGRVIGIRGHRKGEPSAAEHARVVVGADGKNSMMVKTVGAAAYDTKAPMTAGYYAYWSGLPIDEFRVYVRDHRSVVVVPTHDDQKLVLVGWPRTEYADHKNDIEGTYLRAIADIPELDRLISAATRETRFVGTGDMPNAFRTPFGPGWALVGDAGYVRDPCTAQGISDSFRDAELLTDALHEALSGRQPYEQAMRRYQRIRDRKSKRMYNFTAMLAPMDPLPGFVKLLFRSMEGNQPAMDRFMGAFGGTVPIWRVFNPLNTASIFAYRLIHRRRRTATMSAALESSPVP